MIYVIYGQEEIFINQKIIEISSKKDIEIIRLDGNSKNFSIEEMIQVCESNSIFSTSNCVLVKDAPFLCKKIDDKQLDVLYEYVNNPVYETDLVLYTLDNSFNSKLKAFKTVCSNAQVIELNNYDYKNFNTYVNQLVYASQLDINSDAINVLNTLCKRSATLLHKNIEILKLYPGKITIDVVNRLATSSDDNDTFDFINALTNKDITKAIQLERKMLENNDSILSLIGLLSNQLRFLYQLAYYQSLGKKKNEIVSELKINEYRYTKSCESLQKLTMNQILDLLSNLSLLDIKYKSDNSINDATRFEMFILQLLNKGK